jgi:hypothetical protein
MTPLMFVILTAGFGAILQELLFWYNARFTLGQAKYRALLRSPGYWVLVLAMAIGSGFACYLWFSPNLQAPRTNLLFGAAFPALFKKAVGAFVSKETHLGRAEEASAGEKLRDYFRVA